RQVWPAAARNKWLGSQYEPQRRTTPRRKGCLISCNPSPAPKGRVSIETLYPRGADITHGLMTVIAAKRRIRQRRNHGRSHCHSCPYGIDPFAGKAARRYRGRKHDSAGLET